MRVLHAADFGGVAPGGFIPLLVALARRLKENGDQLGVVVPRVADASWYPLVRDAGAELHTVAGAREAARFARAWGPDVAHVHFFGWEPAVTAALWWTPARILWHAHSTALAGGIKLTPRSLFKYRGVGARVAVHVAVSRAVAGELQRRGAPRERIVVVPNAVDRTHFRPPSATERTHARSAAGVGERPAVLFFGRDPFLKGADVLRDALAHGPRASVIAVATPPQTLNELRAVADVISVERTDDVRSLLWAADALAMPSRGEGFGLVLLEAAATGLPVAASDLPALRETAEHASGMHFAPAGDARALAIALRDALARGRVAVPDGGYDPDAWAKRVIALYGYGHRFNGKDR